MPVQIQTKYTPDPRLVQAWSSAADASTLIIDSVNESIQKSLKNLSTSQNGPDAEDDWIDCLILHCHMPSLEETVKVWQAMEAYVPQKVRVLGISNIDEGNLELFFEAVTIKPSVVQNPFQSATGFDTELRYFCAQHNITYQAFFVLKKNKALRDSEVVENEARALGVSQDTLLMYLVAHLGNASVLNGTRSIIHMEKDVKEFEKIRTWYTSQQHLDSFAETRRAFEKLLSSQT